MTKAKSWSVKGVDDATRDLARYAAQTAGLPIGTWIDGAVLRAARGELPGIAVASPTGTTDAGAGSAAETIAAAAATAPAEPPAIGTAPQQRPAPHLVAHPEDRVAASPEAPPPEMERDLDRAGPGSVDGAPRNADAAATDGFTDFLLAEPPRPRPLPQQTAQARPSRLRYAVAATALVAIVAGGAWIFSELSSPDRLPGQHQASGKVAAPAVPAPRPPATTDGTAPAGPSALAELPENIRLGFEMAKAGDAKAQHDVGLLYLAGRYVDRDPKEAARWFEKSAVQGLAAAQFNLGVLYQRGEGVEQNPQLAFFWFQSAAEQNDPRAQHNLAAAYAEGRGVPRNYDKAIDWFTRAANTGLVQSQYSLGRAYETGSPEHRPDLAQAKIWYAKAAAQGDAAAAERLRALETLATASKPIDRLDAEPGTSPPGAAAPAPESARPVTRADIRAVQQLLRKLNFDPGPADGQTGRRTTEAIRLYQKFAGIEVDGRVTKDLLEELRAVAQTVSDGR